MAGVNRVGAFLLGLVLFAAGVLTVVVTALAAAGYDSAVVPVPRWRDSLGTTAWSDPPVLGLSIVVGLVGLGLLALELRRWPPRQMATGDGWRVSRRSVEARTATAARSVPGVRSARATARHHRKRGWSLRVDAEADVEQREPVDRAVRAELARLGIPDGTEVHLDLHRRRVM
jgi:hypothetical protein